MRGRFITKLIVREIFFHEARARSAVEESGQIQLREQNSSLLPNSINETRNTEEMQSFLTLKPLNRSF